MFKPMLNILNGWFPLSGSILKITKLFNKFLALTCFFLFFFFFRLTINALAQKLNAYWKEKTSQENLETSAIVRPIPWVVNLEYKSVRGNISRANGRNRKRWCFSHKEVELTKNRKSQVLISSFSKPLHFWFNICVVWIINMTSLVLSVYPVLSVI